MASNNRLTYLECARGIASVIVVVHHFLLAFYPWVKTSFWSGQGLGYTPGYIIMNGDAAVTFFFVLSGFVLSVKFYRHFEWDALFLSLAKRLPRLMVPVGASIFLGLLVLKYAGNVHLIAATVSHSPWLETFGNAQLPAGLQPSFFDALKQCLLVFLVGGHFYYNSNLWTMRAEFVGSILVFGLLPLSVMMRRYRFAILTILYAILIAAFVFTLRPLVAFMAGSYLAFIWATRPSGFAFSSGLAWGLLLVAVAAFSSGNWLFYTPGSVAVIVALLGNERMSSKLSGRFGLMLGVASFPLYLVHTLVILSVSCAVYLALLAQHVPALAVALAAFFVTMLVSILASIPFVYLDRYWTARLNAIAKKLSSPIFAAFRAHYSHAG